MQNKLFVQKYDFKLIAEKEERPAFFRYDIATVLTVDKSSKQKVTDHWQVISKRQIIIATIKLSKDQQIINRLTNYQQANKLSRV